MANAFIGNADGVRNGIKYSAALRTRLDRPIQSVGVNRALLGMPGGTPRVRPPRRAAVTITAKKDGVSYADVIRKARSSIKLVDLGFQQDGTRIRRAMNGGLVIEVLGADGAVKADRLAEKECNLRRRV